MAKTLSKENTALETNYTVITGILFWCALIVVSSVYVTTPLISHFSMEFQVTETIAAWSSSSFSLFYGIGFLLFGPLADRFGRKPIIVFGLFSLTVVTLLIGLINSFIWLVILRGVQGFVAATFAPTALAYVFDTFPRKKIGTAVGFISFGYVTSGIFGQVIADLINQTFDWYIVFLVFSGLYFVTALCVLFGMPSSNIEPMKKGIFYYLQQTKKLFSQPNFIYCYAITIMLLLTFIGMYTVLGDYLSSFPYLLTDKQILSIRALGLIGMILSPLTGLIIKRIGMLSTLRLGLGLGAVGLLLMGIGHELILIIVMSIIYVAGISIIFPAIMMVVGELGGEIRALANSFYAFILFIGAMLGPMVGLMLIQMVSFPVTFSLLASLLMIGIILSFFIKI